jgi:hypothetical protein
MLNDTCRLLTAGLFHDTFPVKRIKPNSSGKEFYMIITALKGKLSSSKAILVLLCFALALLNSCGKAKKEEAAPVQTKETAAAEKVETTPSPFDSWQEYSSDRYGFSISTPRAFEESTQKTPTEVGDIDVITLIAQAEDSTTYVATYSEFPEQIVKAGEPLELLRGGKQGVVDLLNGTVTSERELSLDGNPGLEIILTGTAQGYNIAAKGRFYLVKNRLYQIYVMAQQGKENTEATAKFLDSFRLK